MAANDFRAVWQKSPKYRGEEQHQSERTCDPDLQRQPAAIHSFSKTVDSHILCSRRKVRDATHTHFPTTPRAQFPSLGSILSLAHFLGFLTDASMTFYIKPHSKTCMFCNSSLMCLKLFCLELSERSYDAQEQRGSGIHTAKPLAEHWFVQIYLILPRNLSYSFLPNGWQTMNFQQNSPVWQISAGLDQRAIGQCLCYLLFHCVLLHPV